MSEGTIPTKKLIAIVGRDTHGKAYVYLQNSLPIFKPYDGERESESECESALRKKNPRDVFYLFNKAKLG
jgi:hypothetical protein